MSEPIPLNAAPPQHQVRLPLAQVLALAGDCQQAGRQDHAVSLLDAALKAAPRDPDALHLADIAAYYSGELAQAADHIGRATTERPLSAVYFRDLCSIYERLGRYEEAVAAGERALQLDPFDALALHNLSVVNQRLLRLDAAIGYARRAVRMDPHSAKPHLGLAELLLLQGAMEEGFEEYEWRFRVPEAGPLLPQTDRPQWDGQPITDGTLLLIADQGFGDVLQFVRYLPWAASRCADLVLACAPELHRLIRHNYSGIATFECWNKCPPFAVYCPLSGLPRLHGTRPETIPAAIPYLLPEPAATKAWAERLRIMLPRNHRRVGIVWSGRAHPPGRSTSLAALAPLAAIEGVSLVSLQMGDAQAEVGDYFGDAPLLHLGHELADFSDTAAVLANLDLLVTIDTAVAHLAGALGKPVWVMLPYSPDWRWLLDRADSPWYPTARLFRQPAPRRWEFVVAEVAAALHDAVRQS